MVKPAHVRVTFEGVTGTPSAPLERWAFGLNFPHDALSASESAIVDDPIAVDCKDAYVTNLAPFFATDQVLTKVKVARIGADGHVELRGDGSYRQGVWEGSAPGPFGPKAHPLQTALCVSLTTLRSGPTGKGRYFLPMPATDLSTSTKRLIDVAVTDYVAGNRAFLNELTTVMTFAPQVVSSKGYMSEVIGLRIGHVPDTMRSRREDAPEGYVSAFLA